MKKTTGFILFSLLSAFLGAIAGAIVWVVLKLISVLTDVIWEVIPEKIPGGQSLVYMLIVCTAGGVVIGLYQRKFGILPDNTEEVFEKIRKTGGYPYDRLWVIGTAAVMPLIF